MWGVRQLIMDHTCTECQAESLARCGRATARPGVRALETNSVLQEAAP